jgi:hypothetical protein
LQGCSGVVDFHLLDIGARAGADLLEGGAQNNEEISIA